MTKLFQKYKLISIYMILTPNLLLGQTPTVCDLYNTLPFNNEMGTAILDDGCVVQILSTGPDELIAPPIKSIGTQDNGAPTGDDELLYTFEVGQSMLPGTGQLFSCLAVHSDLSARPVPGEFIYTRVFNRNSLQTATYYGDSPIYTCTGDNGEAFVISLPPENNTNHCLEPFVQVGMPDTLGVETSQITIPIRVMQDPTGLSLWKYECRIVFADTVLDNPIADHSGTLTDDWSTLVQSDLGDKISLYGEGSSPLSEIGDIVNITFDVVGKAGDSTGLEFEFFTFNQGEPEGDTQDGSLKIVPQAAISGTVRYWSTEAGISDTKLALSGSHVDTITTDGVGFYERCCLPVEYNYTFTPSKTGDIRENSIIAYDASLAAQIALGLLQPTNYQNTTADVDISGTVIAYDAACIARFAVELPPLPGSQAGTWTFDPTSMAYEPLFNDQVDQDFTALLLGDVDGNWTPEESFLAKLDENVPILPERELWVEPGCKCVIPFFAPEGTDIFSFDLDLSYPPQKLKFIRIEKSALTRSFHLFTNSTETGRLRLAAYNTAPVWGERPLVKVVFEMHAKQGDVNQIKVNRFQINNDVGVITSVQVNAGINPSARPRSFSLRQNYPNPFNPETQLRFDLPTACNVRLEIFNLLGQRVRFLVNKHLDAGYHTVKWDATDDQGVPVPTGMYLYRITAQDFVQERKMILLQ